MPIVDMKDMLQHAYHHGYAVGAFELVNLDFLQAVMNAAEEARAPVILSLAEHHFDSFDFELLMPAVEAAAKRAQVPVALHFDHGTQLDSAVNGIKQGCNSVMVDASHLDFLENTRITQAVVTMAHTCGIAVEGELGYVPGLEEDLHNYPDGLAYTSLAEAKAYTERTGIDFLAVSVGTVHGRMKGKPRLDYQRLKQINEALGIPLVIHGGSGLSDSQYRRLISNGIAKINCFTGLSELAAKKLRENARSSIGMSYSEIQSMTRDAMTIEVERYMRLWGAAGRAAEVLSQCQLWTPAQHLLIAKMPGEQLISQSTLADIQAMLTKMPGVREVNIAEIVQPDKKYQYSWTVTFCHPEAMEYYQKNLDFVSLNRKLFNPMEENMASFFQQSLVGLSSSLPQEQVLKTNVL